MLAKARLFCLILVLLLLAGCGDKVSTAFTFAAERMSVDQNL